MDSERASDDDRQDLERGCLSLAEFAARLMYLKRHYAPFALPDYARRLRTGTLPPEHAVVLTFDDAFSDVYVHALPLLIEASFPFTVFLTTGWVGCDGRMLSVAQIRDMAERAAGLVSWGAHGVRHRPLTDMTIDDAEREIVESRKSVEGWVGGAIDLFCYPDGKFNDQVEDVLRKHGFTAACATGRSLNAGQVDPLALKRIPFEGESFARFAFRVAGRT